MVESRVFLKYQFQRIFSFSPKVQFERKTAKMIRKDLQAARDTWIEEAKTEGELENRRRSSFLLYEDDSGLFADFHANRHMFITNLARAGVSPKVAQTLARHSDIRLTMNFYTHTVMADRAETVAKQPGMKTTKLCDQLERGGSAMDLVNEPKIVIQASSDQRHSSTSTAEHGTLGQSPAVLNKCGGVLQTEVKHCKPLLRQGLLEPDSNYPTLSEVHLSGFEPETFGSVDRCSIQLSYRCNSPSFTFLARSEQGPTHWISCQNTCDCLYCVFPCSFSVFIIYLMIVSPLLLDATWLGAIVFVDGRYMIDSLVPVCSFS